MKNGENMSPNFVFFCELRWGKAMVAYTKPQQRKKEERQRGERDQIKFIDLRFERWPFVRFGKQEDGKRFHKLHVLEMNDVVVFKHKKYNSGGQFLAILYTTHFVDFVRNETENHPELLPTWMKFFLILKKKTKT